MTAPSRELSAALARNPVFARTEPARLAALAHAGAMVTFAARDPIFTEGDPAAHLYLLDSGVVRVFHVGADGLEVTVKHLSPPATFGEMEVLSSEPFLESTVALSAVRCARIEADAFRAFMASESATATALLADVCARFCVLARNEHAILHPVPARLASLVLAYAELFGKPGADGMRITHPLTQTDLANALGVVVRSVGRALAAWQRQGWMSRRKGWLVVHDVEALAAQCAGLRFNLNYRVASR